MIKTTIDQIWRGKEVKIQGKKVVNKSAYQIGLIVEGQAKELAPKNYGYLAASITTQSMEDGTEPDSPGKYAGRKIGPDPGMPAKMKIDKPNEENVVLVGTGVSYAIWQEFGCRNMNASPFLRPALDLARGRTLTILEEQGKKYFADYLRRPE